MRIFIFGMLIVWLYIVFSFKAKANELEFIGGGVTEHLFGIPEAKSSYRTVLGDGGNLIFNPVVGLRYEEVDNEEIYTAVTGFAGDNSIGRPMIGGLYEIGLKAGNNEIGLFMGGYEQQHRVWGEQGIQTLHMFQIGDTEFMPLTGMEVNFKVPLDNDYFIAEHNLFGFGLINLSLGFGKEF